jgi:hypothetical protein
MKRDEYGFTLVNFGWLMPLSIQSFAFPMHIEQVSFAKDGRSPRNWKVVLWQKPKAEGQNFLKRPIWSLHCLTWEIMGPM